MTEHPDQELEALLREQQMLPVPLALISRVLDAMPAYQGAASEPVRPWLVAGRAAAAIVVFFASWFAFSGQVPALADVVPEARLASALETSDLVDKLPGGLPVKTPSPRTLATAGLGTAAGAPAEPALAWTAAGLLLLLAGAAFAWRTHRAAAAPLTNGGAS